MPNPTYLFVCIIMMTCVQSSIAQTSSIHWPQDGDRVVKAQYVFVAAEADSAVWDFSHAIETGHEHTMQWLNLGDTVLVRIERGNQYTYQMRGDTLLWLGYENPLLGMRDSISPVAWLPTMAIGDSVATLYYFHGKYSGNHAVDMAGTHTVQLMRQGTLILPNDTIADALLVREVTDGKVRVSPELTDAPISAVQDSLLRHVEMTDRWFSPKHRYPVAENVSSTFYAQGELRQQTRATYLCTPDVQELALGDVVQPRHNAPRHSNDPATGYADNSGNVPPLGERLTVNVGDGQVAVCVSGSEGTDVTAVLSDIQGRVWSTTGGNVQGGAWQGVISTSQLPTGNYLLHVASDNDTETKRVTIP